MRMISFVITLATFAVAAYAQVVGPYPVVSYNSGPAVASSALGHSHGIHGDRAIGYATHGASSFGDHGHHGDKAFAAKGYHNVGAYGDHDTYGGQANNFGRYRSVGSYDEDKGSGYVKSYAYDKAAGHHGVVADHGANLANYGVQNRRSYFNMGGHGTAGHARSGAHDTYGNQAYGINAQDSAGYGSYGSSQGQMYNVAPALSASYASPGPYVAPGSGYIIPGYY